MAEHVRQFREGDKLRLYPLPDGGYPMLLCVNPRYRAVVFAFDKGGISEACPLEISTHD